jgi:hypothetical protein
VVRSGEPLVDCEGKLAHPFSSVVLAALSLICAFLAPPVVSPKLRGPHRIPATTLTATPIRGAASRRASLAAWCSTCVANMGDFGEHTLVAAAPQYPVAASDKSKDRHTASAIATRSVASGPPTYRGSLHQNNTQLTIIPVPNPVPSIGNLIGAGRTYTPPAYGNAIIRCTDVNTDPANTEYHSFEVSDSGAGSERMWNSNHTLLRMMEASTGTSRIVGFNQATGRCTTVNPYSSALAGAVFARHDPNVDYILSDTVVSKRTFDYTQPLLAPVITEVFDFRTCPGLANLGTVIWNTQLGMSYDDDEVGAAFSDLGGQDTGEYAAVYWLSTGQCQVWNTLTGQSVNPDGQVLAFFPFTIHDATLGPGGVFEVSPGTTCTGCSNTEGPFLLQAGGLTSTFIATSFGGHNAIGYQKYVNIVNSPKMVWRDWNDVGNPVAISSVTNVKFPANSSTHVSWQNVDPADSYPIFAAEMTGKLPQPINITTPLENEIWAIMPATGEFIRVAPCMTSGIGNVFNFRTQYCITGVSPDGACIAFNSDWEGTLGNTDGVTSTCTLGSKLDPCVSDVFIVCPK